MDNEFSNSPFKGLSGKNLPSKSTAGRDMERAARQARRRVSPEEERENALFLSVMDGVEPTGAHGSTPKGKSTSPREKPVKTGFAFAEHCDLPGVKPLAEKKRKGANARKAAAKAQAQEAAAASARAARKEAEESTTMASLLGDDSGDPAFAKAMEGVAPLQGGGRDVSAPVVPSGATPLVGNALQDFLDGKLEFALSFTEEYIEGHVVGLDMLTVNKLAHGMFSPEASIDLHGLNVQQAFETLRGFFKGCWYRGMRCVIVVPGRGHNSPNGVGVLREKLKTWLTQDPFKHVVLAFCTARSCDGGAGSLYVLLRKFKKKGRVYWDRMPADEDLL